MGSNPKESEVQMETERVVPKIEFKQPKKISWCRSSMLHGYDTTQSSIFLNHRRKGLVP